MKKLFSALMLGAVLSAAVLGAGVPSPASAAALPAPSIVLDGLPLPFPVPPMIVRDRTMVPFRAIAEALGVTISWNGATRTIDARGAGAEVRLVIDDNRVLVNGVAQVLDVPPTIVSDRTLLPLRFFSEVFGAKVGWDGATRTVSIASPPRPMRTMAFYAISSFSERNLVPKFSNVAYGWSTLKADGTVDLTGGQDYRWPQPSGEMTGEKLLADAKATGVKRYLMVSAIDSTGEFTRLVLDPALNGRAAAEIAATVAAKGFDGVVLDMEYLGYDEQGAALERVRQGYTRLVQGLADRLRPQGREVVVSLHPLNGSFHGYDYKALSQAADMLQVMAHDYVDHTADVPAPEPAGKVTEAIEMALREVPREKLLLGIVAPYETPETFGQKVGLAKRYSLAGLSVWRLGTVGADRMSALEAAVGSVH